MQQIITTMSYDFVIEIVKLIKVYEQEQAKSVPDITSFGRWLNKHIKLEYAPAPELDWLGKSRGRTADSVINTTLLHLYRYAKLQAKEAIVNSPFSTPDEFIYLICLNTQGSMTKTALIKLNVHEKSAGIQIINRLIDNEFVTQKTAATDRRNKILEITDLGKEVLNKSMDKIRQASRNVTQPLSDSEKIELIRLMKKLEDFHEEKRNFY